MKRVKKLTRMLFLVLFVFGTVFAYANVEARVGGTTNKAVPTLISAQVDYPAGTLLKIKNRSGAAVYQIDSNGKKHVFPDEKTFKTWHDNFNEVVEVDQATLDLLEDGAPVTFQPGVNLVTTPCTAMVYAAGDNGELLHIADEATAVAFYGKRWQNLVKDVDCGMFAVSYKVKKGSLGNDNLPDGTYVQDEASNKLYLLKDGLKRRVSERVMNKLAKRLILRVKNVHQNFADGEDLDVEEEALSIFDPGAGREKALICHKGKKTLRVSSMAVPAHLAHGSTEGPCDEEVDEPVTTLPVCDHNGDGVRNLADIVTLAQCQTTFDVNGDGVHNLVDASLYSQNNQNDAWCTTNFVCDPNVVSDLPDLEVSSVSITPNNPVVNEDVVIEVRVKNKGVSTFYDEQFRSLYYDMPGFWLSTSTYPTISATDPFSPGESIYHYYYGKWDPAGTTYVEFGVDTFNNLEESDETNNIYRKDVNVLPICDHNADGVRNLSDVALFAGCRDTFDVNGDGLHDLVDVTLYSQNSQDNAWCATNFVCNPNEDNYPGFTWSYDEESYTVNDTAQVTFGSMVSSDPYDIDIYGMLTPLGEDSDKFLIKSDVAVTEGTIVELDLDGFETTDDKEYQYSLLICSSISGCTMGYTNSWQINIVDSVSVCDHNDDGLRNLSDLGLFSQCQSTFDVNGDGIHNLADVTLYAQNNQDDAWCAANFVCDVADSSASTGAKINVMEL